MQVIASAIPSETAGDLLTDALTKYQQKPILLMLSGGSAMSVLKFVDLSLFGQHLTITTLDERFSTDPTVNNFAQLQTTDFFIQAISRGVGIIDTTVKSSDTLAEAGERFEQALRDWRKNNPDGVVLVTAGIGLDGHTAGIFPGEWGNDFSGNNWVVAYKVPSQVNLHQERITTTYTFLRNQVTEAVVCVFDPDKQLLVEQIQQSDCSSVVIPACVWQGLSDVKLVSLMPVATEERVN